MSDRRSIFNSIFTQYLETFSSHLSVCLESNTSKDKNLSESEISDILSKLFFKFPRIIPLYGEIIGNLALIAMNDTDEIISFLTKSMKEVLLKNSFSIFAPLQNFCVAFEINDSLHVSVLYYFSLFFLSDLLCQIVAYVIYKSNQQKAPTSQSSNSTTSYSSNSPNSATPPDIDNLVEVSESSAIDNSSVNNNSSTSNAGSNKIKKGRFIFTNLSNKLPKLFHGSKAEASTSPNIPSMNPSSPSHNSARSPPIFSSSSISNLTRAGYNLATAELSQPELQKKLIQQWSVIFSLLSERNFEDIYQLFQLFSMTSDLTLPILLYRYIRFDVDDAIGPIFFNNLMTIMKGYIKKKTLNNCILESVSAMLITLPYDEDTYLKLFNMIYPLRKDKNLSGGALFVLSSIFIRYNKMKVSFEHFFEKRILLAAGDKTKTQTVAECFFRIMLGRNVVPEILFWEFGNNPILTPLSFLKFSIYSFIETNSAYKNTFHSDFMNSFFVKSDFSICPHTFTFIIVYLASLNFKCFVENVVPPFLELNENDPRFIAFLNSIPKINSDDFFKNCFSKVHHSEIKKMNSLFREKVIKAFLAIEPPNDAPHGVCVREVHFLIDSLSDEADQKVSEYLNDWGMSDYFKPSNFKYKRCKHMIHGIDLSYSLLNVLKFVLIDEDYSNVDILRVVLKFACSINNAMASSAYRFCIEVFPDKVEAAVLVKISFNFNIDNEFDFIVNTIIFQIFKKQKTNRFKDEGLLRKVEIMGFFLHASTLPVIRNLGREILYEVHSILGEKSMVSLFENEITLIEKVAKSKLILCNLPYTPQRDLPPASTIPFHFAFMSHYYDVWLFYFAEMLNILILRNFTPLTEFYALRKKEFLQSVLHNEDKLFIKRSVGHHIIILSTNFHIPDVIESKYYDPNKMFQPFNIEKYVDNRAEVANYLNELLHSNNKSCVEFSFGVVRHLHYSLLPSIIEVMAKAPHEHLLQACSMVGYKIRMPDISHKLFKKNINRLTNLLTEVDFYLVKSDFSRARKMDWSTELENRFVENESHLKELCFILIKITEELNVEIDEMNWPTSTREIICRSIYNYATLKSEKLKSLKLYSDAAYNAIVSVGPSLTSPPLFDEEVLLYLAEKSVHFRSPALYNLLYFHFEMLFNSYLHACLILPRVHGDAYFSCIVDCLLSSPDNENAQFILKNSGKLLFLAGIYFFLKHPKAKLMIKNLLKVIKDIPGFEYLNEQYNQMQRSQSINNICDEDSSSPRRQTLPSSTSNSHLKNFINPSSVKNATSINSSQIDLMKLKVSSKNLTSIDDTFYQNSRAQSTTFGPQSKVNHNNETQFSSSHLSNLKLFEKLPDIFSFATEGVFDAFFNTIKMKKIHVSFADVTESVHPWLRNIRLLPNRTTCANDVPPYLNYFTPYDFLSKLTETTETICEDNLRSIILMWIELSAMPDHIEIIPCFLIDWDNQRKKRMFQLIGELEPTNLMKKFVNRYTFSYYYYYTEYLKRSFDQEQEMLGGVLGYSSSNSNNIFLTYRHFLREKSQNVNDKDKVKNLAMELIHFSFLFYNKGTRKSFNFFCSIMEIQNFEGSISPKLMRNIAKEAIKWFPDDKLEAWGNEALKWVFGCKDIQLAITSFLIYNNIMKPFNKEIIHCVIRALSYHLEKAKDMIVKNKSTYRLNSIYDINDGTVSGMSKSRSKSIDCIKSSNIKMSSKEIKAIVKGANDNQEIYDDSSSDSSSDSCTNTNYSMITEENMAAYENPDVELIEPFCNFLSETFVFMKKSLDLVEGDEKDYFINMYFFIISSFLDCRMFVDSTLIEATPVIMEFVERCFNHKEKSSKIDFNMIDKQLIIQIIRPRLKDLWKNIESQQLLSQFINYLNNELEKDEEDKKNDSKSDLNIRNTYDELIMIALPIKMVNPHGFPTVKFNDYYNKMIELTESMDLTPLNFDYNNEKFDIYNCNNPFEREETKRKEIEDSFFDNISASALCKSIVHYSTMIQTDSLYLQNIIFYISSKIVDKLDVRDNENNKLSLAKIYSQALRTMTKICKYAVDFIQVISKKVPNVVSLAFYDYYEWERSIEDVDRNMKVFLKKFIQIEDSQVTITDCKSYSSVKNFLFIKKPPQILPFVTYEKMKNGMKSIRRRKSTDHLRMNKNPPSLTKLKKTKKKSHNSKDIYSFPASVSIVFGEDDKTKFDIEPLIHPTKLILDKIDVESLNENKIKSISAKQYLLLKSDDASNSES